MEQFSVWYMYTKQQLPCLCKYSYYMAILSLHWRAIHIWLSESLLPNRWKGVYRLFTCLCVFQNDWRPGYEDDSYNDELMNATRHTLDSRIKINCCLGVNVFCLQASMKTLLKTQWRLWHHLLIIMAFQTCMTFLLHLNLAKCILLWSIQERPEEG